MCGLGWGFEALLYSAYVMFLFFCWVLVEKSWDLGLKHTFDVLISSLYGQNQESSICLSEYI